MAEWRLSAETGAAHAGRAAVAAEYGTAAADSQQLRIVAGALPDVSASAWDCGDCAAADNSFFHPFSWSTASSFDVQLHFAGDGVSDVPASALRGSGQTAIGRRLLLACPTSASFFACDEDAAAATTAGRLRGTATVLDSESSGHFGTSASNDVASLSFGAAALKTNWRGAAAVDLPAAATTDFCESRTVAASAIGQHG